jgi:hypothetical protein
MIQITVIDPAKTPRAQLAIAIAVLQAFHDGERAVGALAELLSNGAAQAPRRLIDERVLIDADDRPDAGAGPDTPPNPAEAFGSASAAAAFGAPGNVPAAGSAATSDPTSAFGAPAAASAPSVAAAPAPAGQVELDVDGLPWDTRIHASTKGKNQDGRWKAKRGVEPTLVAQVQAELRAVMGAPAAPVGNATTGAPATPPVPMPPAPPAPPAGIAAPAPGTTPTAPAGVDFPTLAKMVGELIPAGRLTNEALSAIVAKYGLPGFGLLFNRPDLVPAIHADIMANVQG